MNLLLGINTVLALFALFASTLCILGWICIRLLKFVARGLSPLVKDDEQAAPTRPRPRMRAAGAKAGK